MIFFIFIPCLWNIFQRKQGNLSFLLTFPPNNFTITGVNRNPENFWEFEVFTQCCMSTYTKYNLFGLVCKDEYIWLGRSNLLSPAGRVIRRIGFGAENQRNRETRMICGLETQPINRWRNWTIRPRPRPLKPSATPLSAPAYSPTYYQIISLYWSDWQCYFIRPLI